MVNHDAESADGANERERELDAREERLDARDHQQVHRTQEVDSVLANGALRDKHAAARDWEAGKRDMAANMDAWLSGEEGHGDAETRQAALDDRMHAESDRESSAVDRRVLADLAEDDGGPQQTDS